LILFSKEEKQRDKKQTKKNKQTNKQKHTLKRLYGCQINEIIEFIFPGVGRSRIHDQAHDFDL